MSLRDRGSTVCNCLSTNFDAMTSPCTRTFPSESIRIRSAGVVLPESVVKRSSDVFVALRNIADILAMFWRLPAVSSARNCMPPPIPLAAVPVVDLSSVRTVSFWFVVALSRATLSLCSGRCTFRCRRCLHYRYASFR